MNRSAPLTPEERALARLLGRPAPTAPSSALDEAVLAAARASLHTAPVAQSVPVPEAAAPARSVPRAARRRSRLPAALGLAASVVFAVGIAWQLKPDAPQPAPSPAPSAAVEALPTPAAAPQASEARHDQAPMAAADVAEVATAPVAKPSTPPPAPPRADTREPLVTRPAPAPIVAAPMPPPAAPVAAPSPSQAYAMDAVAAPAPALEKITTTGSRARQQATDIQSAPMAAEPARSAAGAPGVMRRAAPAAVSGTLSDSAVNAAVDADATLPRKQWLQRIRERRDNGDVDTARASLERYLQHYPETRVPRDVRQLLDN
ncbi:MULTISPECIES: hypothetical protein [unclassified Stenotrophomonas]|uniref:hypothetical protein n=1 Tax=unclassified Stenotrophomonas TaxID=196198 RepID=UPI002118DA3C|nr:MULTISPECIES: hypothetical protein [unclassified Stenotrophomonas]